jgi:soluble lytic murein transglycosylase-like protein
MYTKLIQKYAAKYNLDPFVVAGIIYQESAGKPKAYRFEPGIYKSTSKKFLPLEASTQATSFGLMQVLGSTARWLCHYTAPCWEMIDAETSIDLGCQCFAYYLAKAKGDIAQALAFYNTGSRPKSETDYDDKVLSHVSSNRVKLFYNP